jgi:transposase
LRPLSAAERQVLEGVVKASSERVDRVRRAQALLAVAETGSSAVAARPAGFGSATAVAKLVNRCNQQGVDALDSAAGRGRRPTYDRAARAPGVAVAQQQARRREDQTATWSLSTLQRHLRREGLARSGTSTIRRVLQDAGSS